jgi:hypothetical protein
MLASFACLGAGVAIFSVAHFDAADYARTHCRRCGYDLGGNPLGDACPECGAERR